MKAREEELEKKLKDAEDAKFAKDGEVSILRASLAKVRSMFNVASVEALTYVPVGTRSCSTSSLVKCRERGS